MARRCIHETVVDLSDNAERTYQLQGRCYNCHSEFIVKLAKGQSKPSRVECPFCECYDGIVF